MKPAKITLAQPQEIVLSGRWTADAMDALEDELQAMQVGPGSKLAASGAALDALDSAGAWVLQQFLQRLRGQGMEVTLRCMPAEYSRLLDAVAQPVQQPTSAAAPRTGRLMASLDAVGHATVDALLQARALLAFVGETALVLQANLAQPKRMRWKPILFNIRSADFDALPIVGLLSFLLGIVVAYQAADQLRQYGANIFVADLVGLSMLREFAPLMTAIIIAGRSGSAYAAQIGTMAVTEEIDAMRTIGIEPLELLVLPKIIALVIALPLLTVFADLLGVLGGMVMARAQLGVSYAEFLDRFAKAISVTSYLIGIGKAPVFAAIIAVVGCFQGLRTKGGADSVGRQTTRSVVQGIFLVIVADALFSIAFSLLDL